MNERTEPKKRRMSTHARVMLRGAEDDTFAERERADHYAYYDSSEQNFDAFFAEVLLPYKSIREYTEAHYGEKKGKMVAVEFGGPARKLFAGMTDHGLLGRSAGFVLHDARSDDEKARDSERHHSVIEADVFFKKGVAGLSWRTVEEWVRRNGKPDIAIERMVQGVDLIRRADLYVAIVKRWLSQLAERGTLLAEIPRMMPLEERKKVAQLLQDDSLQGEEVVFSKDKTRFLFRRAV
ncbi:hypothetical protein A3C20_02880 [Candidatus Kaiserbacteria bacterium RIFCSPHIGHO2_02_FULL_55_25]|uniref:Uncharacterized protein n=2 Tax=Parcubacteria group TaxID=1794811 RepID=A0A1F6E6R0_9BACT|nr:MAG: hypothetical protein A2764_02490 [Candidatus Kaiserbacteria bacterium RIFCSPHIGHO2_01_FULL_55_79]OGG68882.1 MAG: hypothetical protein A3C20_02880 [Candidatus Kaiserbacteria bacterium RIFCSPHIGHO2_02_FULL_55_25]OGG77425.1 MAG: hypothetical protein A3F56_02120 [Candidatus Kaiserbacteria bacterium RIFCSPHIGHO2_12_FULL_55_13]